MSSPTIETPNGSEYASPADLSRHLSGTPEGTLAYWRHVGKGPRYIKPGKRVLYRWSDIADWLDRQTSGGDAA